MSRWNRGAVVNGEALEPPEYSVRLPTKVYSIGNLDAAMRSVPEFRGLYSHAGIMWAVFNGRPTDSARGLAISIAAAWRA